jgi:hypothetical protein
MRQFPGLVLAAVAAVAAVSPAFAAPAKTAAGPSAARDLDGFWELRADSKNVPRAALTPQAEAADRAAAQATQSGEIVGFALRWCHHLGTPFIMGDSAPLDIVQSPREVAIMAEVQSAARHIYLNGSHPDPDVFDPTTNGHSIGRWEGDVLVVDTVGFNDKGNNSIPGGGRRGPNSHLVERYRLADRGAKLVVTFTWTDPAVFTKPHTYEFTYYRDPPGTYAAEYFCDASQAKRGQSVIPPPQQP